MSAKKIIAALIVILLLNVFAIISIEYDRRDTETGKVDVTESTDSDDNSNQGNSSDNTNSLDTQSGRDGTIGSNGAFTDSDKDNSDTEATSNSNLNSSSSSSVPNSLALAKVKINQSNMASKHRWIPTNYAFGDITTDTWVVQRGDTLAEIAEARYGSCGKWTKIRDQNYAKVRRDKNGMRTVIISGQLLKL